MLDTPAAAAEALDRLRREAAQCRRCPLWAGATQTVFGEGSGDADLVFVGEQPGDKEDLAGRPFVGPAGRLFDAALAEAGIDRRRAYVTNAVKHFKNEPRGPRRIHKTPTRGEVIACKWWLDRELDLLAPKVIVALGATALGAIAGKPLKIGETRGRLIERGNAPPLFATVHPSYLLRLPDPDLAARERERFVADLAAVAAVLADPPALTTLF